MIKPIYITSGVMILLLIHLWGGIALIVHHNARIFFEKLPHIVVEETSLGHFKCRLLWYMNEK